MKHIYVKQLEHIIIPLLYIFASRNRFAPKELESCRLSQWYTLTPPPPATLFALSPVISIILTKFKRFSKNWLAFSFIKIQTDKKEQKESFVRTMILVNPVYIKFQQYHGKDGQIKHPIVDVPTIPILYYDRAVSK